MGKDPVYADYAYVTYEDIKKLMVDENGNSTNDTLLAIRAPVGTQLEVPDPELVGSDSGSEMSGEENKEAEK